ncbi:pyridoxal 5'-phosphate synthase [Umezawaea sp. Da 62-37]|uniref:pyridoxine/pyridoxamine 5'-phosphate oxidase n=1 Tax=Umezawaea sp. Da 62-37 TaxID=3075927 RepID=UPI0028F6DFE6|nr:pyridoxal 5'-phosphate synthase [Umezawaea sp. Da 62-37]WNV88051.1 pyridoxal 5'-phosphate synthase [Umezawaea sp. Da 62-37]
MTATDRPITRLLRSLPSLAGPLPSFDPDTAPDDPDVLFEAWLRDAVAAGLTEPHSMTLSTVDPTGRPSARVLILKNLDGGLWQFASGSGSRKGKELADTPWAALTFYWPALGRQVRVRGAVTAANAEDSARDYLGRSPSARAAALLGRQSDVLRDPRERERQLADAAELIRRDPAFVAPEWTLYGVRADEVEFWQGDQQRNHTRLRYTRTGGTWTTDLLWP